MISYVIRLGKEAGCVFLKNLLSEYEARSMICEYGRRLYSRGLVAGNEGNISCRIGDNEVIVTPTMESKGYMDPDMLVKVDLDCNKISGSYDYSSETLMHLGIYKARKDITAVVHAHPVVATAFACCGKNVKIDSIAEAALFFGGELIVTPYAALGTAAVPESIAPHLSGRRALLLGNHGALTWAATLKEACFLMESLEQICRIFLVSEKLLDGSVPIL